jgi:threonine dehydrogenase-like Zn-dependent dehydrogenase
MSVRHTRITVTHYGGPDELQVVEEECPEPKSGEVRVRVLAAAVCLPDLLMREGVHPETTFAPEVPEQFRRRHWGGYREVMRTGHTKYGTDVLRVPAIHKDGRTVSIAFTVTLMRAPDTQAWVIAAIIRDETTRWNEERELRRRLAELEAKWT